MLSKFFDKSFFIRLLPIAIPLALRHFLGAALGIVDTMMIGRFNESAIGAIDLANQVSFIFFVSMIGATSGCSIFALNILEQKMILVCGKHYHLH